MTATLEATTAAVTTTGPQLREALRWATGMRGSPAAGAVRVTVSGGELILAGYDFETVRLADLELQAAGQPATATVLVPAAGLLAAARALPAGKKPVEVMVHDGAQVDLTAEPGTVRAHRITTGTFGTAPGYPNLPPAPGLAGMFDGPAFRAAALRVCVAASGEQQLPWLTAVRMQTDDGQVWMSATDRYQIAIEPVPVQAATAGQWLFPGRELAAFAAISTAGQAYLLGGDGDLVGLTDGTWTVLTRRVTGEPVDVRRFIAQQEHRCPFACQVTVDAPALAALLQAGPVKIKGAVAGGKTLPDITYVDVVTAPGQDGLSLRLEKGEKPWAADVAARVDGGKLVAGWNPAKLAGLLGVLDGPAVIHLAPGDSGRVLNPVKITCPAAPGWTGMLAMVDPSK